MIRVRRCNSQSTHNVQSSNNIGERRVNGCWQAGRGKQRYDGELLPDPSPPANRGAGSSMEMGWDKEKIEAAKRSEAVWPRDSRFLDLGRW